MAGRKEWVGLAVLVVPIMIISMDNSVLYLALPSLTADLEPSSTQTLWILDIYGFILSGLLITMGSIGDRIGRRRLLMIGGLVFGLASLFAALSTSPEMLMVARIVLGIGGATIAPSTLSLIRNMFSDPTQRKAAIALWTAGFAGGSALGPVLGGVLLEYFWWGSVFLINIPIMVVLLCTAPFLLPEFKDPDPGPFDPISVALSITAMLSLVYAVKHGAQEGIGIQSVVTLVVGLVLGVLFVRRLRRTSHPLIDLDLFRERSFSAAIFVQFLLIFVLVGFSLFSSQFLQLILGLGPLEAGLWTLIPASAALIGSVLAPPISERASTPSIVLVGLTIMAGGCVVLAFITPSSGLLHLLIGLTLVSSCLGLVSTLGSDIVMTATAPEKAGSASALSETGAELGGAAGIAILGTIGAAVYRSHLADAVPAGTPQNAVDAARETLGGATVAASQLPTESASALLTAAQTAFVDGYAITAGGTAVFVLIAAGLTYYSLRRQPLSN